MPNNPETNVLSSMPDSQAKEIASQIRPHAVAPFHQPQPANAWDDAEYRLCRGFVMCTHDQAVPIVGQQAMIQYSGCDWAVAEIDGGHCAYIDRPSEVGEAILDLVSRFESLS